LQDIQLNQPAQYTPVDAVVPVRARPKLRRRRFIREIIDTLVLIGAIYALVNLTTARFIVQGPSMMPNFETGQFLIVSRINYMLEDPDRGDIVVFHFPGDPTQDYIKRVIGLPGDTIEFSDGQLLLNGELVDEPYINEACRSSCRNDRSWEVGPDQIFVMGDNRNRSSDSRSFGPVDKKFIVGKALIRYWPPSDWGIVDHIGFSDFNLPE